MATTNGMDRQTLFDCTGLVAVVTGGGTGLGLTMARALATNGATVYILGRRLSKLQEAAASIASQPLPPGAKVLPLECDATSKPSLQAAASHIAHETGYINLLLANAGVLGPNYMAISPRQENDSRGPLTLEEVQKALWESPVEDFAQVYKVNVAGAFYTTVAFLELLDKGNKRGNVRQTSQVVVTSSIAGFHRSWQMSGMAYTTSKAAVTHLVKSLAGYLVQWKVRVNAIAPGFFPSDMLQSLFGEGDFTVEGSIPRAILPLERVGREEEMAGTVLYLASEAGAYCCGSIQLIDGGRLGVMPGSTY